MTGFLKEFEVSLIADDTDLNRKKWARKFVSEKTDLRSLLYLLDAEKKLATRFIWLIGDICESNPPVLRPFVKDFFKRRNSTQISNYNRSLAKMFMYCGIPKEIEGEVTTVLFDWLIDPNVLVTTKNYSMLALFNLTVKYPELKPELEFAIKDQLDKNTISFKKTATQLLNKLNKTNIKGKDA